MKRRKPNPYDDPKYKMAWGKYAGKRIQRIPAQYFLDLEREGWAFGDIQEWITKNKIELKTRAREENGNGYTEKYEQRNAYRL